MRIDGIQRHAPIFVQTAGTCNREVPAFRFESSVTQRAVIACRLVSYTRLSKSSHWNARIGSIPRFASIGVQAAGSMPREAHQNASECSVTTSAELTDRPDSAAIVAQRLT